MSETASIIASLLGLIGFAYFFITRDDRKRFRKRFYEFRNYRLLDEVPGLRIVDSLTDGKYYLYWREEGGTCIVFFEQPSAMRYYIADLRQKNITAKGGTCINEMPYIDDLVNEFSVPSRR